MTTYRDAVRRLQIIYNECTPKSKDNIQAKSNLDDFTRLRKEIHADVKVTRNMLKERDELLGNKPSSKEGAEMSYKIRAKIKIMNEELKNMKAYQAKELKKTEKSTNPDVIALNNERNEVIELVSKHIEEVENLEKKRITDKITNDRTALFSGANPVSINMVQFKEKPTGVSNTYDSALPDIDPDVAADLQMLQQADHAIDQDIDQIGGTVNILRQIAIDMDHELDKQNGMLDNIERKVDKAQDHLDKVNVKMKEAIDGVMKGDKFMVNCILLCVVLGLLGWCSQYFLP